MTDRIIERLVVLMLENRSFDHLFGYRPGVNGLKGNEGNLLDPTQPESERNLSFCVDNGAPFAITVGQGRALPQRHEHPAFQQQERTDRRPAAEHERLRPQRRRPGKEPDPGRYPRRQAMLSAGRLPSINMLADNFLVCDNWYADAPGPTQANRLLVHAATSSGYVHSSGRRNSIR
jgi:phospholipase C